MRSPLIWRRNGVDRSRYEQVIDQRDDARKEAANHVCKIVELCNEIDALRDQYAAARAGAEAEKRRADQIQARLDDACGFNHPAVEAGQHWQERRLDKPRPAKETTS